MLLACFSPLNMDDTAITPKIETRGLVKEYGKNRVVNGVDINPVSYTHLTLPTICSV